MDIDKAEGKNCSCDYGFDLLCCVVIEGNQAFHE